MRVVMIVALRRQVERTMGFQSLSHLQVPNSRVRQLDDALSICTPNRDFWILNEMLDVGNNVLREDGDVRRCDDRDQYELYADLAHSLTTENENVLTTWSKVLIAAERTKAESSCRSSTM